MSELGEFIKKKRELEKMSQKKLGSACGVSDSEIMKIENGTRKKPNWNTLCKIAQELNFHPFEILLLAGYITENDVHPYCRLKGIELLSPEELETVQLFLDFLITQQKPLEKLKEEHNYAI